MITINELFNPLQSRLYQLSKPSSLFQESFDWTVLLDDIEEQAFSYPTELLGAELDLHIKRIEALIKKNRNYYNVFVTPKKIDYCFKTNQWINLENSNHYVPLPYWREDLTNGEIYQELTAYNLRLKDLYEYSTPREEVTTSPINTSKPKGGKSYHGCHKHQYVYHNTPSKIKGLYTALKERGFIDSDSRAEDFKLAFLETKMPDRLVSWNRICELKYFIKQLYLRKLVDPKVSRKKWIISCNLFRIDGKNINNETLRTTPATKDPLIIDTLNTILSQLDYIESRK